MGKSYDKSDFKTFFYRNGGKYIGLIKKTETGLDGRIRYTTSNYLDIDTDLGKINPSAGGFFKDYLSVRNADDSEISLYLRYYHVTVKFDDEPEYEIL